MTDFNFGFINNLVEVARHADANIDTGPVNTSQINILNHDFTNIVANADRVNTVYGSDDDFVWGDKWGNSKTRVN